MGSLPGQCKKEKRERGKMEIFVFCFVGKKFLSFISLFPFSLFSVAYTRIGEGGYYFDPFG
jgi:hypothetical protein